MFTAELFPKIEKLTSQNFDKSLTFKDFDKSLTFKGSCRLNNASNIKKLVFILDAEFYVNLKIAIKKRAKVSVLKVIGL